MNKEIEEIATRLADNVKAMVKLCEQELRSCEKRSDAVIKFYALKLLAESFLDDHSKGSNKEDQAIIDDIGHLIKTVLKAIENEKEF